MACGPESYRLCGNKHTMFFLASMASKYKKTVHVYIKV